MNYEEQEELEEYEDTIPELRNNIINLLHMNFELLISQCRSCIKLQGKIDKIIESDEKLQRDLVFLLNSLQTRISETIDIILPLMKKDDLPLLLEKRLKEKEEYKITDPKKREAINELKGYIGEILDKEEKENNA